MSENKKHLGLLGPAPTQAELSQAVRRDQQTLIGKVLSVCESLQAENEKQRQENERLYLIQAIREYKLRPKKRGPRPKPKIEIDNTPKKRGRPTIMSDELLVQTIDSLKDHYGFNDKSACFELSIFHLEKLGLGRWRAESEARKLQTRLSKARKKIKAKKGKGQ